MADRELNPKQEHFVSAYLGDAKGNASEAARIAGYKHEGVAGHRLLKNVKVASRVKEQTEQYAGQPKEVLDRLHDIATADWREFVEILRYDKSGKPIKVRMDLTNQVRALELLGKYHQLFVEKQQIDVNIRDHRVSLPQSTINAMFEPAETNHEELDA
jgi:phage terminase small subunit